MLIRRAEYLIFYSLANITGGSRRACGTVLSETRVNVWIAKIAQGAVFLRKTALSSINSPYTNADFALAPHARTGWTLLRENDTGGR
jgi:hypothetical protein